MSLCTTLNCILLTLSLFVISIVQVIYSIVKFCVPRYFKRVSIEDKIVLITGAGSGLGRMVALRLAAKGAIIVSWDVNHKANSETVDMIQKEGGRCHSYTVDLCDRHAIYNCATRVKAEVGKVDILINNAGIVSNQHYLEATDEQILRTFDVNILSHFWTTKVFLPEMMRCNSGHVVTVSSVAGMVGAGNLVDYCSSKFAAVGLNECLFLDLNIGGYTGVHTTVICPYFTNTGMFNGVKSKTLPILEPEYVADEMTDAILTRTKTLIIPVYIRFYVALRGIMPHSCILLAYKMFTGKSSMQNFIGHKANLDS